MFSVTKNEGLSLKSNNMTELSESIINNIINNASKMSPFAYEYHLKKGYITIEGGHRIGFTGKINITDNKVDSIKNLNSLNIRINKNRMLFSNKIFKKFYSANNLSNVCIISPPGCGKTTFLRNYITCISEDLPGINLCIIDEREELYSKENLNVSFISDCPKNIATEMAIRSMSPQILIYDEIYTSDDYETIKKATCSGVKSVFSVHGKNYETLCVHGLNLNKMCSGNTYIIELSNRNGCGTIENIRRLP